jgi:hypothetical protein
VAQRPGALIVEVLDARGGVHHRVRLDELPATIGRAYSNDVILDDPYICPQHARLALDERGELVAEDLGSVNGLRERGRSERLARVALRAGSELRVGRTLLRVCLPDQPVAPTAVDATAPTRLRRALASPRVLAGVCATTLGIFLLQSYLGDADGTDVTDFAGVTLVAVVLLGLWSGFWAVLSRIVSHSFRFLSHLALACAVAVGFTLVGAVGEWVDFFVPGAGAGAVLTLVSGAAALIALFYGHLALVSSLPPRRLWRISLALSAAVVAVGLLVADAGDEVFSGGMNYSAVLKPVGTRWVHTVSLDEFMRASTTLREEVDRLARED